MIKNEFWETLEQNNVEKFLTLKKNEVISKYQNCFVLTTAQMLIATKQVDDRMSPFQICDYVLDNYTENKRKNEDGSFVITIKNPEKITSADSVLIIRDNFEKEIIEYIQDYQYAHIMQKYKNTKTAHFIFTEVKSFLSNKEIEAEFELTTIHLYKNKEE